MPAAHKKPSNSPSQKPEPVITTAGQIFPDGVIDLVASADPCRPNLILWNGHEAQIAPQICHAGSWYQGPVLHPTIARHVRFPHSADTSGSAVELFSTVADWLQEYFVLPRDLADQITLWQASTWLSDRLPSPPALIITGAQHAARRRLVPVARVRVPSRSQSDWSQPGRPPRLAHGPESDVPNQSARHFASSLAVAERSQSSRNQRAGQSRRCSGLVRFESHVSGEDVLSPNAWSGEALWIYLPPAGTDAPALDEQTLARIAQQLQSKFLGFRLKWLCETQAAAFSGAKASFSGSELAQSLFACVRHEPELIETDTSGPSWAG